MSTAEVFLMSAWSFARNLGREDKLLQRFSDWRNRIRVDSYLIYGRGSKRDGEFNDESRSPVGSPFQTKFPSMFSVVLWASQASTLCADHRSVTR
jgi:hypothetical protein